MRNRICEVRKPHRYDDAAFFILAVAFSSFTSTSPLAMA